MKRAPSKKALLEAFPDCDPDKVRAIIHGTLAPDTIPQTAAWIRQCYGRPSVSALKMHAIDVLIGGYGVESIANRSGGFCASYVNMGDPYVVTIVHAQNYQLTTMGDFVESYERKHGQLP